MYSLSDTKNVRGLSINRFCRDYLVSPNTADMYMGKNPYILYRHYQAALLLNVLLAIGSYALVGFDLLGLSICFVSSDIVLCLFDRLLLSGKKECSISDVLKQKNYVDKLNKDLDFAYLKTLRSVSGDEPATSIALDWFNSRVQRERQHLKMLEQQALEVKPKEDTKLSKDYEDKMAYITDVCDRLEDLQRVFIYMAGLTESLESLSELLKAKPAALGQVPYKMYVYLDELQKVANQILDIDTDNKEYYKDQLQKVTKLLQEQVEEYISAVKRYDERDIEVSLNVLLSELKACKDGEERVHNENNI